MTASRSEVGLTAWAQRLAANAPTARGLPATGKPRAQRGSQRSAIFPVGTRVRVHVRSPLLDGKVGPVVSVNLGEIGVTLGGSIVWFLATELERISA